MSLAIETLPKTGDRQSYIARDTNADGTVDSTKLTINRTTATEWGTPEDEAATALAESIARSVSRPFPTHFRFGSDTVPPKVGLAGICAEIDAGRWEVFASPEE